jgi:hypothetical protein
MKAKGNTATSTKSQVFSRIAIIAQERQISPKPLFAYELSEAPLFVKSREHIVKDGAPTRQSCKW